MTEEKQRRYDLAYLKMAKGVGALRTLSKPFDRTELIKAVKEVMEMDV